MKINVKITMALLALGIVAQASADNVVYLTGSTAFRSTVYNALHTVGDVFDATNPVISEVEFGGSSASGANYMLFHGTIGGTPTYIDCAWSGSEAGIASACGATLKNVDRNGSQINLAGSPETWLLADGSVTMNGYNSTNPAAAELEASSHIADIAQADTSQAVSLTPRVISTSTDLKDYGVEGVVTFTWVKNINTSPTSDWTDLVNLTLPQVDVLLGRGYEYPALFTGNNTETNRYVYLVGRNKGSGTRANTLVDHNYGPTTKSVVQFSIGYGIEEAAIANDLVLTNENNNGYESGGGVATALGINGSCQQTDPFFGKSGWFAVGYLGCSDALSHSLAVSPNWLTLDGVGESSGAIEEGQYYFWGHEHLYGRNGISGYQDTDAQVIYNGIKTSLGTSGSVAANHDAAINLVYMHCDKASDVAYPVRSAGFN